MTLSVILAFARSHWRSIGLLAALAGVWLWHGAQVRGAYKAGYAAAMADQMAASAKDSGNADKAEGLKALIECHKRQLAGEKVIWHREKQKCVAS